MTITLSFCDRSYGKFTFSLIEIQIHKNNIRYTNCSLFISAPIFSILKKNNLMLHRHHPHFPRNIIVYTTYDDQKNKVVNTSTSSLTLLRQP
jgi:hypothetical protein